MTHSPGGRETAEAITTVIASRVRELRTDAGMSQAALAERMAALGQRWTRLTVVNLEKRASGTRGSGPGRDVVTTGELLALAQVLGVPPVWLLADPAAGTPVPVAEGEEIDPWSALMWMIGKRSLVDRPGQAWDDAEGTLDHIVEIHSIVMLIDRLREMRDRSRVLLGEHHDEQHYIQTEREALEQLPSRLERLAARGIQLPKLPSDVVKRAADLGIELPGQEG